MISFTTFLMFRRWRIKDVFNDLYKQPANCLTIQNIFRDVYGNEYIREADQASFLTRTDLQQFVSNLSIGQGQTFIDLGCGRGGPGLWVARETGANLTGIDISEAAVKHATNRVGLFDLEGQAQFQVGDFINTKCSDERYDGAMSVDALFLVPDKAAAVHEVARVLRPGALFVFTTYEIDVPLSPLKIKGYGPILQEAGFEIGHYGESSGWKDRQLGVAKAILAEKSKLIDEMGKTGARVWIRDAQQAMMGINRIRRIFVVAKKQ